MTPDLASQTCEPCHGDVPALEGSEIDGYRRQLGPGWEVVSEHHLEKSFEFDDFVGALDFVNRVGQLAEEEGHHPELCFTWGEATVRIWTHAADGLTENDFILAAKIDEL